MANGGQQPISKLKDKPCETERPQHARKRAEKRSEQEKLLEKNLKRRLRKSRKEKKTKVGQTLPAD